MPRVTLQPSGWTFTAKPGESLLQAARAAGILMPKSCRNGSCRECRCQVLAGTASHRIEWPGLSAEEKAEGWILPCVAVAESDLVLEAPRARQA